jgi:hypothetical protein
MDFEQNFDFLTPVKIHIPDYGSHGIWESWHRNTEFRSVFTTNWQSSVKPYANTKTF